MNDQVICIVDWWDSDNPVPPAAVPQRGQVYTVTKMIKKYSADYYVLWEMDPGSGWRTDCFRKCRPTDISCFKTKVREREDA